jgi:hypothetical protein
MDLHTKDNSCPMCNAGVPSKVMIPVFDKNDNKMKYMMISQEKLDAMKVMFKLTENLKNT